MKTSRLIYGFPAVVMFTIFFSSLVYAEGFPEKTGYLIDSRGNVVKNSYGQCWRTGYWTPAMAIEECDPDLVKAPKEAQLMTPPPVPVVPFDALPATAAGKPVVVHFYAKTLFDFDKAVVKPDVRKILDEEIVAGMKKNPDAAIIIITGHADRIGAEEYNQDLSERRANAVRDYLVAQGIPAERIRASGKGESEPNPEANTSQACKGMRGDRLIACLQPDRRVTVESQRQAPE